MLRNCRKLIRINLALCLSFTCISSLAEPGKPIHIPIQTLQAPPPIGLYTPGLSQPGPLIAFGENILDQGQVELSFYADDYGGSSNSRYIDLEPSILYGITDRFSAMLTLPYAASYQLAGQQSSGLEDIALQFEYAYYTNSTNRYQDQATLVVNATAPTGDSNAQPRLGNGSPTYFIGATYNRTFVEWFYFLSPGVMFTTTHDGTKYGNQYLYQLGFGNNLFEINKKWIVALVTEFDGQYTEKTTSGGLSVPNTGGNIIYVTPSLSISGAQFSAQAGFGVPIIENTFDSQPRANYLIAGSISWTFN